MEVEDTSRTVLAPCCNIQLQWIGPPSSKPIPLFHEVDITGTTEPDCSFTISYYPGQYRTTEQKTSKQRTLDGPHRKLVIMIISCMIIDYFHL